MTIEELLELPPEGLEALTDEALVAHLSKYFQFSRPQQDLRVLVPNSPVGTRKPSISRPAQSAMAKAVVDKFMSDPDMPLEKLLAMRKLVS
jgi:hypothetical protein